jgi:hypothetical protein
MDKVPKLVEREDAFCESIDCTRNKAEQFIYCSKDGKSMMNLPYILLEYKQWMIEQGFIKQLK